MDEGLDLRAFQSTALASAGTRREARPPQLRCNRAPLQDGEPRGQHAWVEAQLVFKQTENMMSTEAMHLGLPYVCFPAFMTLSVSTGVVLRQDLTLR